jgi:phage terminase Nu1 subunit (DNA packaging protein)
MPVPMRARLVAAQADLAEAKAAQLRDEVVPLVDVESEWISIMRALRTRVLSVAARLNLSLKDTTALNNELRQALTKLGHDR